MGQFRLVLRYENPSHFEQIEVQADGLPMAIAMCDEIMSEYSNRAAAMESRNVFASRRICSCGVDQNAASSSLITTVT